MYFSMRISLPDRPGMLGAMATALSDGGANIVALDVIDREEGEAVDDLVVGTTGRTVGNLGFRAPRRRHDA
ncbi:MAG: ACT domain-containing protein [Actinobacteria bacterium]|nr:ACT domain-containing protein [Actinomycetota bacterium]